MLKNELNDFFVNNTMAKFYKNKPKDKEYFGVIEDVYAIIPFCCEINGESHFMYHKIGVGTGEKIPLLFKKIDDETILEVSTGIPFLLEPELDFENELDQFERFNKFKMKIDKYRRIGLIIEKSDYIVPNDEFKKIYNKALEKNMKSELISALKESHELFDNELPNVINKAYYDLLRDKNNKIKTLTKPSDDQK